HSKLSLGNRKEALLGNSWPETKGAVGNRPKSVLRRRARILRIPKRLEPYSSAEWKLNAWPLTRRSTGHATKSAPRLSPAALGYAERSCRNVLWTKGSRLLFTSPSPSPSPSGGRGKRKESPAP